MMTGTGIASYPLPGRGVCPNIQAFGTFTGPGSCNLLTL